MDKNLDQLREENKTLRSKINKQTEFIKLIRKRIELEKQSAEILNDLDLD